MSRTVLVLLLLAATAMTGAGATHAQDTVAVVETWQGRTVTMSQPGLDALYTIVPPREAQTPGAVAAASGTGATGYAPSGGLGSGPTGTTSGTGPPPIQGRMHQHTLTVVRDGVEFRLPLSQITALTVERRGVASSHLPPYVSPTHATYSVRALLTDGSIIDGASLNSGTTILRGSGPHGTIEVPLEDVKSLKITR